MSICHFAAHTRHPIAPLCEPGVPARLWTLLRAAFPDAFAAVIMPNHVHFVAEVPDIEAAVRRLRGVLGTVTSEFSLHRPWLPVEAPTAVRSADKLLTDVRYIHLNPCRPCDIGFRDGVRLVGDPLRWEWSTHRDVTGAVTDPWVTAERLARAVGRSPRGFAPWFHQAVSSDRHVAAGGTAFPVAAPPRDLPSGGLDLIAAAAAAAHRVPVADLGSSRAARATFVALAHHQGWSSNSLLGRALGVSYWTVRRIGGPGDPAGVRAAALCLGDARLRERSTYRQAE